MSAIPSGSAAAAAIATPAGAAKPAPEFLTPGGDSKDTPDLEPSAIVVDQGKVAVDLNEEESAASMKTAVSALIDNIADIAITDVEPVSGEAADAIPVRVATEQLSDVATVIEPPPAPATEPAQAKATAPLVAPAPALSAAASQNMDSEQASSTALIHVFNEPAHDTSELQGNMIGKTASLSSGQHDGTRAFTFKDFSLKPELLRALADNGLESPSDLLQERLPQALLGENVVVVSRAGVDKSRLHILATLHRLVPIEDKVSILVLCHSKKLAKTIKGDYDHFARYMHGVKIEVCSGVSPLRGSIAHLEANPPHIMVATPGRMKDLIVEGAIKVDNLKHIVFVECDKLLNVQNTRRDTEAIYKAAPRRKQVMLFAMTMSDDFRSFCKKYRLYDGTQAAKLSTRTSSSPLKPELLRVLAENGLEKHAAMNQDRLSQAMLGKDVVVATKACMDKTTLYVLATLHQLIIVEGELSILVLCHSKERANHIKEEFDRFVHYMHGVKIEVSYGEISVKASFALLEANPPHIMIATPGRTKTLLDSGVITLENVKHFVLDEGDVLLKHADVFCDVEAIFEAAPRQKQVLLYAQNMTYDVRDFCRNYCIHEQAFERNAAPSATPLSPPSMVYSIDRWANSSFQSSPDPSHLPTLAPMFILRSLMAEQGATPAAVGASSEAATSGNNTAPSPEVEMPAHEAGAEAMANTNAADSAPVSKTNVSSLTPATAVADGTILSRPMPTLTVPQQKPAASPLAAVPVQSAAFSSELDLQTSKQYETPSLPNSEKLL